MFTLTGSVGKNGTNRPSDVGAIQFLLNLNLGRVTPFNVLVVDGQSGPATVRMIEEFQRRVVHALQPDGRVDPHGTTLRALTSALPESAPANKTARFEDVKNAGKLNQMMLGRITINSATYLFRSGGFGRGNLPAGQYQVAAHLWDRSEAGFSVGGVGYSFALSDKLDPRVSDTRTDLRIHPDGGQVGTNGCIGIVGAADTQTTFREGMRSELDRNQGKFTLTVQSQ